MRQDEGVGLKVSRASEGVRELQTRLTRFRECFIGPFTARERLTNNGGFNDLFKMGVASVWAHSRGSREPHLPRAR